MRPWGRMIVCSAALGLGFSACDSGGGKNTPAPPTFTAVYKDYLKPGCGNFSSCHQGGSPAGGLDLGSSQQEAYDALVSIAAQEAPDSTRVVPGSSATSYVIAKIVDPSQGGSITTKMTVDPGDLRLPSLKAWIDAGAKND